MKKSIKRLALIAHDGKKAEMVGFVRECGNDSSHEFSPSKNYDSSSDYDQQKMNKIRNGEYPTYSNHAIFQCLLEDGLIEEANYIVDVCW